MSFYSIIVIIKYFNCGVEEEVIAVVLVAVVFKVVGVVVKVVEVVIKVTILLTG